MRGEERDEGKSGEGRRRRGEGVGEERGVKEEEWREEERRRGKEKREGEEGRRGRKQGKRK